LCLSVRLADDEAGRRAMLGILRRGLKRQRRE
jgi:hypothetical protein